MYVYFNTTLLFAKKAECNLKKIVNYMEINGCTIVTYCSIM